MHDTTPKNTHWEAIYQQKNPNRLSWTEGTPATSLNLIKKFKLPFDAAIIDIGGGDSKLVDHLLAVGYNNLTVLDISATALDKAKARLGKDAHKVHWIHTDITKFNPPRQYDLWHDRATFHFLTHTDQITEYQQLVNNSVRGHLVLGTFSDKGPEKCSGLQIRQYNEETLPALFTEQFEHNGCQRHQHQTPFGVTQEFIFCWFTRK